MEHGTLETLLNVLPGVRVDKSGNILVDDDEVVYFLVDGREIFGEGKKQFALTSIQAYAVEEWDLHALFSGQWLHSTSDIPDFETINTMDLAYGLRANGILPWNIHVGTTFLVNTTRGYQNTTMNADQFIWNAQLSRSFLGDQLVVAVKGVRPFGSA